MPCIKCISKEVKETLLHINDPFLSMTIETIPLCEGERSIEIEERKRKRKSSKYNQFVGECIKSGQGSNIKDCAALWAKSKN
ncbi:MAG: hypothetical protein AB1478_01700 [Nitrospirota bacterium]